MRDRGRDLDDPRAARSDVARRGRAPWRATSSSARPPAASRTSPLRFAELLRGRRRLRRRDAGLRRPADPHEPLSDTPDAAGRHLAADHEASVGEYAPLAHAAIDERARRRAHADRRRRYRPLLPRRARRARASAAAAAGRTRAVAALYDEPAPTPRTPYCASSTRRPRERVHPNDRRRVVRALELADAGESLVPGDDTLCSSGAWRHPTLVVGLDVPKDVLEERIADTNASECSTLGVEDEARRALRPASRRPRARSSASTSSRRCRAQKRSRPDVRTRRYAAYQRKWMRSLEGVVMVAADRPPEETAAEIVELARAREHLPRP